jgi:hypothetical protein
LTPLAPRHEYNRGVCVLLSRSETMSRLPLGGCSFSFAIFPQNQENQKENYHNNKKLNHMPSHHLSAPCHPLPPLTQAHHHRCCRHHICTHARAVDQDAFREVVEKGGCCLDGFFCFGKNKTPTTTTSSCLPTHAPPPCRRRPLSPQSCTPARADQARCRGQIMDASSSASSGSAFEIDRESVRTLARASMRRRRRRHAGA